MDSRLEAMADRYSPRESDMRTDGRELSVMDDMGERVSTAYELDCESLRRDQVIQNTALTGDTCW